MPAGVSAYTPLANITLSSSVGGINFGNFSSGGYRDLVLIGSNIGLNTSQQILVWLNLDSGSNYNRVQMQGNGSSANSVAASNTNLSILTTANFTSGGQFKVDILDILATDKHKTFLTRYDNAGVETVASAIRWANTAAVTDVTITAIGTTFTVGSTFALYGVSA
jgi:hypothetical protein